MLQSQGMHSWRQQVVNHQNHSKSGRSLCKRGHGFFEGTKGHQVVTLQWGLGVGVGCPGVPATGWEQIMNF